MPSDVADVVSVAVRGFAEEKITGMKMVYAGKGPYSGRPYHMIAVALSNAGFDYQYATWTESKYRLEEIQALRGEGWEDSTTYGRAAQAARSCLER